MEKIILLIILICILFSGCNSNMKDNFVDSVEKNIVEINSTNYNDFDIEVDQEEIDEIIGEAIKPAHFTDSKSQHLNLTVWSFQVVNNPKKCIEYAKHAIENGFDGIDFCATWNTIELQEGEYDWKFLDECLDIFAEYDLNLSLSLMFWTGGLEWAQKLNTQQNIEGETYIHDNLRGPCLCYNDPKNLKIMKNTLQAFAKHTYEKYGNRIERFHARTSCFGELEYSPVQDLDYSPIALDAFYMFLEKKIGDISVFNKLYDMKLNNWDELKRVKIKDIIDKNQYDWKLFKQDTVLKLIILTANAFRSQAPEIPVAIQVGCVWDQAAASLRGIFDAYLISRDVDILHTDDTPTYPHNYSIDMIASIAADKKIAVEMDGVWQIKQFAQQDIVGGYLRQAEACGAARVEYLNTANWEPQDLLMYGKDGENLVSKYRGLYYDTQPKEWGLDNRAIFVNTADFISSSPAGLDTKQIDIYNILSENGKFRVRFITDTMIAENPEILDELTNGLYLGNYTSMAFEPHIAEILAEGRCKIYNVGKNIKLSDPYKQPLDKIIEKKLLSLVNSYNN